METDCEKLADQWLRQCTSRSFGELVVKPEKLALLIEDDRATLLRWAAQQFPKGSVAARRLNEMADGFRTNPRATPSTV